MKLHGILPPLTTPFSSDGAIDLPALQANIQRYNQTRLSGYVMNGSTSESVLLTWGGSERDRGAGQNDDRWHGRGIDRGDDSAHEARGGTWIRCGAGANAELLQTVHDIRCGNDALFTRGRCVADSDFDLLRAGIYELYR